MKNRPFKVMVCAITLAAFLSNTVLQDLAWASSPVTSNPLPVTQSISIPSSLGSIKDSWSPTPPHPTPHTPHPTIIHIQDAHCNYFAQSKIAEIIKYLNDNYGVSTVNLEGGTQDYDLALFTGIKDKAIREKAADHFVREGVLNGAEYFAANNPEKVSLWGIEDTGLYIENLRAYRDSLAYKDDIDKSLKILNHALSNLKVKVYSKELLELDRIANAYKEKSSEFKDYISYLAVLAERYGIDISEFENIAILTRTMSLEPGIDFKRANIERDELIDRLTKALSRVEVKELVERSVDFKLGRTTGAEFYSYLTAKSKELRINLDDYKDLARYIGYAGIYSTIKNDTLFKELGDLEGNVKEKLYENSTQKELDKLSKNLVIIKNIFGITLTPDDHRYYTGHRDEFRMENYVKFVNREAPLRGLRFSLDNDLLRLDDYLGKIENFYTTSLKRDAAFLKNLKFSRGRLNVPYPVDNRKTAILITGGFHSENLALLFKKNNISYISIMPNFRSEDDYVCPYFKLLSGSRRVNLTTEVQHVLGQSLAYCSPNTPLAEVVEKELSYVEAGLQSANADRSLEYELYALAVRLGYGDRFNDETRFGLHIGAGLNIGTDDGSVTHCQFNAIYGSPDIGGNIIYLPYEVAKEDEAKLKKVLGIFLRSKKFIEFDTGAPFKDVVAEFFAEHKVSVHHIGEKGAGLDHVFKNTDGEIYGGNEDGDAWVDWYKNQFGSGSLPGKRVVILGGGPTGIAIASSLLREGVASLGFTEKNVLRGESMAKNLGCEYLGTGDSIRLAASLRNADIVINATGIGKTPGDPSPISGDMHAAMKEGIVAVDLNYRPKITPFLEKARERGAVICNGTGLMLTVNAKGAMRTLAGSDLPIAEDRLKKAYDISEKEFRKMKMGFEAGPLGYASGTESVIPQPSKPSGPITPGSKSNVTCGTICEAGHQELLDPEFETYYGELARDAAAKGMIELDRNLKEEPLTELEVVEALFVTGKVNSVQKTQLEEIIKYIHEQAAIPIPDHIQILFAIPPDGKNLWWIEDPDWKEGDPEEERMLYAGGHPRVPKSPIDPDQQTRIHISLPLILAQADPKEAALAVAEHDYRHITGGGHQDDEGMRIVRKAAGARTEEKTSPASDDKKKTTAIEIVGHLIMMTGFGVLFYYLGFPVFTEIYSGEAAPLVYLSGTLSGLLIFAAGWHAAGDLFDLLSGRKPVKKYMSGLIRETTYFGLILGAIGIPSINNAGKNRVYQASTDRRLDEAEKLVDMYWQAGIENTYFVTQDIMDKMTPGRRVGGFNSWNGEKLCVSISGLSNEADSPALHKFIDGLIDKIKVSPAKQMNFREFIDYVLNEPDFDDETRAIVMNRAYHEAFHRIMSKRYLEAGIDREEVAGRMGFLSRKIIQSRDWAMTGKPFCGEVFGWNNLDRIGAMKESDVRVKLLLKLVNQIKQDPLYKRSPFIWEETCAYILGAMVSSKGLEPERIAVMDDIVSNPQKNVPHQELAGAFVVSVLSEAARTKNTDTLENLLKFYAGFGIKSPLSEKAEGGLNWYLPKSGIVGAAIEGDEERAAKRLKALERRLGREGGINKILEDVNARALPEDKALIRNALGILGMAEEEIGSALKRIRLVEVRNRRPLDRPGRPRIGGIIVGTASGPKVLFERFRLKDLSADNTDDNTILALGDLLHESVEYDLTMSGMAQEEAHWHADRARRIWETAWRAEEASALRAQTSSRAAWSMVKDIKKQMKKPWRLGEFEAQFGDIVITLLNRQGVKDVAKFDPSSMSDDELEALGKGVLKEMALRGWFATLLFRKSLNIFLTRKHLSQFKKWVKGDLRVFHLAIILERLHTITLNPEKMKIAEEKILEFSDLFTLISQVAPTNAQSYRILSLAGLAGELWDGVEASQAEVYQEVLGYLRGWEDACRRHDEAASRDSIGSVFEKFKGGAKIHDSLPVIKAICDYFNIDIGRMEENCIMHIMNKYNEGADAGKGPIFIERFSKEALHEISQQVVIDFLQDGITRILNACNRLTVKNILITGFVHKGFDAITLSAVYHSGPHKGRKVAVKIRLLESRWIEHGFRRSNGEFIAMTKDIEEKTKNDQHFANLADTFEMTLGKGGRNVVEICDYIDGETLDRRLGFWGMNLNDSLKVITHIIETTHALLAAGYIDMELDNTQSYVFNRTSDRLAFIDYGHVWEIDDITERFILNRNPDVTRNKVLAGRKNTLIRTAVKILTGRSWDTLDSEKGKKEIRVSKRIFKKRFGPEYCDEVFKILLDAYETREWSIANFLPRLSAQLEKVRMKVEASSPASGTIIGAASGEHPMDEGVNAQTSVGAAERQINAAEAIKDMEAYTSAIYGTFEKILGLTRNPESPRNVFIPLPGVLREMKFETDADRRIAAKSVRKSMNVALETAAAILRKRGFTNVKVKFYDGTVLDLRRVIAGINNVDMSNGIAYIDTDELAKLSRAQKESLGVVTVAQNAPQGGGITTVGGRVVLALGVLDLLNNDRAEGSDYWKYVLGLLRKISNNERKYEGISKNTFLETIKKGDLEIDLPPIEKEQIDAKMKEISLAEKSVGTSM